MSIISIILMILTNGPGIIRLIIEIRALLRDLRGEDQKAVMEMCREDLEAFKLDKDKVKLMSAISEKADKFKTMQGDVKDKRGRKTK